MTSYLSDDQVRAIREEYAEGDTSMVSLAEKHGLHIRTIENFIHHRTRKEAGGPPYLRKRCVIEVPEDDQRDIIFQYKCGVSLQKIADKYPEYGFHRVGYVIKKYRKTLNDQ